LISDNLSRGRAIPLRAARRNDVKKALSTIAVLLLGAGLPAPDEIYWYYDAETALQVAKRMERPIVLLKVRADIGKDVKT
jgi:hypothetical protein